MDPRAFHALASKLAASTGAAEMRSASSRAYYAAFLMVDAFLRDLGFSPAKNESRHRTVEYLLSYSAEAVLLQASTNLRVLRQHRNDADYDMSKSDPESPASARASVARATGIIRAVDGFGPGPRRTSVQASIAATLRRLSPGGGPP